MTPPTSMRLIAVPRHRNSAIAIVRIGRMKLANSAGTVLTVPPGRAISPWAMTLPVSVKVMPSALCT